jgi:hypothetical protein
LQDRDQNVEWVPPWNNDMDVIVLKLGFEFLAASRMTLNDRALRAGRPSDLGVVVERSLTQAFPIKTVGCREDASNPRVT